MKEVILFMSPLCPDCPPIVEKLENENINYRKVDITNSMRELKEFLKLRDSHPYFDQIKKENMVGIPSLLVDGENFYNPYDIEDFKKLKD